MLNHIALHCVPMQIGWYFDKRDQRCVRTFMKRPVKLPAQFERSTSLADTLPVSAPCICVTYPLNPGATP
jgi:hypothetical protein